MQVFTVVNNNTACVVTFGAEKSQYQKYLEDVEKLIKSIRIDTSVMKNAEVKQNPQTKNQ